MRLDRVFIDGFKNLHDFEIDFDETTLTTVVIGQNGSGKSNLLEAITDIFRFADLNRDPPRFNYEVDYKINGHKIRLSNKSGKPTIQANEKVLSRKGFEEKREQYFPDLIFGYYSGDSRRMERRFDSHQRRYYNVINKDNTDKKYAEALKDRRLFYCRPIHGVLALLSFFAFPEDEVLKLLKDRLGISGFHSALAHLKEPTWFNRSIWKLDSGSENGDLLLVAHSLWGAKGPAGDSASQFLKHAFHPITVSANVIEDYRDKQKSESQLACFLNGSSILNQFSKAFKSDQDLFSALEAMDISDLFREMIVWVTRVNDDSGDIEFADLSDGERQLLMVLGLIRVSRGKSALFLLDEPDTHLNPTWQHSYLNLIEEWTGVAADETNCQIIMTSHNPLTISALEREEVRVLYSDEEEKVLSAPPPPYTDPRGMGFTATLTEIFGLSTTLDPDTQQQLDERNELAHLAERSVEQSQQLTEINQKLNRLGFMFEDREPLYQHFLQAWKDVKYADRPIMNPDEIQKQHMAMSELIKELLAKEETKH